MFLAMVILFDKFNLPEDILDIIFSTNNQRAVAKLLVEFFKQNNGVLDKKQMSIFANSLHLGLIFKGEIEGIKSHKPLVYNKRQFYDRIITPMKSMGLITYDLYEKKYKLGGDFKEQMMRLGELFEKKIKDEKKDIKFSFYPPEEIKRKLQ